MKLLTPIFLGAALVVGCAAPALNAQTYQDDQNRQANTQAYSAGYAQGQADARGSAVRNDVATSQWVRDDDRRAYQQGYDAGYDNVVNRTPEPGAAVVPPGPAVPPPAAGLPGDQQARQFGYEDGLAAGRHDAMKGDKFKPEDHDLYKNGLHGWTASLGTKDQFKQLYREAFVKGYEEGFRGPGQR
jgi:hypothetical protein